MKRSCRRLSSACPMLCLGASIPDHVIIVGRLRQLGRTGDYLYEGMASVQVGKLISGFIIVVAIEQIETGLAASETQGELEFGCLHGADEKILRSRAGLGQGQPPAIYPYQAEFQVPNILRSSGIEDEPFKGKYICLGARTVPEEFHR